MERPASLFISHGSPDLILHDTAARTFLEELGEGFAKPKGIIVASAHFETDKPVFVSDPSPSMIYDFGPIDARLNDIVYPAPGAPALAEKAAELVHQAGLKCGLISERGYDHGTWVPLSLLYKNADIPIVQLSVQPGQSAHHHLALGKALRPLVDDEILVIGSGAITHNLAELFGPTGLKYRREDKEVEWARVFADWVAEKIDAMDDAALVNYLSEGPFSAENHPTAEHYFPLLVALGASKHQRGERLHKSTQFSVLAMDAFAFH